ncbi:MAG: DUF2461 domain-containing protein, partial [Gemmatimonadaceae bacterium]|nr:DUF2461 domain-containing protein [Gemmatimonadaceae bacterium]
MAALVEEIDVHLATLAPEIIGHPKRSMFRIHRDTRFSNDKSPYKTNLACWFFHSDAGHGVGTAQAHGGAGFYFDIETTGSSLGGGIWMPPRPTLNAIRAAIDESPRPLRRVLAEPSLKRRFGELAPEARLTRMPRGFAVDHPGAELLRHRSFTVGRKLKEAELFSPALPALLAKEYARIVPLVRWLNGALGLRAHGDRH